MHLLDQEYREEVLDDIDSLQLAYNNDVFEKAMQLFNKKWMQKRQKDFLQYMKQMWFSTHQNWFEGASHNIPSTNNGLEAFNLIIKKEDTFIERLPLARFFELCLISTKKWSTEYFHGDKKFIFSPTINLKQWTDSYNWAKSNKTVSSKKFENTTQYYCPPSDEFKVTNEDVLNVNEMRWNTFDQFKKRAFCVWIVNLPNVGENWKKGQCTCPCFKKKYMCKHVIGLAIRLKYVKPPAEAKQIPIGEKHNRGRPKKATKALLID